MMIEALFARDGQTQAFLWMLLCGFGLGPMMHMGSLVERLRTLWDVMTALLLGGMVLWIIARCGAPLRAYAVLGILLGTLLYQAGVGYAVNFLFRRRKTSAAKAGEQVPRDEMNN